MAIGNADVRRSDQTNESSKEEAPQTNQPPCSGRWARSGMLLGCNGQGTDSKRAPARHKHTFFEAQRINTSILWAQLHAGPILYPNKETRRQSQVEFALATHQLTVAPTEGRTTRYPPCPGLWTGRPGPNPPHQTRQFLVGVSAASGPCTAWRASGYLKES